MNKYDIPSKVRIANHWYKVTLCDFIDDGDTFGSHCNLTLEIKVAECMKTDDGKVINLTEEQIKNSFWHEMFHAFNYYYNNKQDESLLKHSPTLCVNTNLQENELYCSF